MVSDSVPICFSHLLLHRTEIRALYSPLPASPPDTNNYWQFILVLHCCSSTKYGCLEWLLNPNRFQRVYMQFMPDDKLHGPRKKFSTLSCMLSPASLIRVIYSFGWHRTSLPVIVSSEIYSAYGFRCLPNYLIRFRCIHSTEPFCPMTTVFILSNPAVLLFYSIAVRFLSKVTALKHS